MGNLIKTLLTSYVALAIMAGLVAAGIVSVYYMAGGGASITSIVVSALVSTIVVMIFKIHALDNKLNILTEMSQRSFEQINEDVSATFNNMGEQVSEAINAQQQAHNEDVQEIFTTLAKILEGGRS